MPSDGVLCKPYGGGSLAAELAVDAVLVTTEGEEMARLEGE